MIDDFGVVFFKFDYNTVPGVGTDLDAESAGAGLLGHCRAYLDWLDDLRRRHPDVMIENCGSGAMRADYAQLQRLDLQSTSDQCDPLIYAAIAAGAGLTILPEQQGNWGYAQQEMDDETAVFTLATGILGRLYLSGFIDRMDEHRLALVRDAVALHRRVLTEQQELCRSGRPVCLISMAIGSSPVCAIRHSSRRRTTIRAITSSSGVAAARLP